MYQKFTPIEIEYQFSFKLGEKMLVLSPKAKTLSFIKQFAYAYHEESRLPAPLAAMILN